MADVSPSVERGGFEGEGSKPEARVRLSLLQGFEITDGGAVLCLPLSVQRLVAFLALRDRPAHRVYVAGSLWPETTDERASSRLRSALWRLQRSSSGVVEISGGCLSLASSVDVDVAEMVSAARRLIDDSASGGAPPPPLPSLAGELLPGWYDDWVLMERERIRQLRLHALEVLCERLSTAGRHGQAVDAGLCAVAEEPLRESAQRALIAAHLREGNACEALRQYQAYRTLLWASLGLEPSFELTLQSRGFEPDM